MRPGRVVEVCTLLSLCWSHRSPWRWIACLPRRVLKMAMMTRCLGLRGHEEVPAVIKRLPRLLPPTTLVASVLLPTCCLPATAATLVASVLLPTSTRQPLTGVDPWSEWQGSRVGGSSTRQRCIVVIMMFFLDPIAAVSGTLPRRSARVLRAPLLMAIL